MEDSRLKGYRVRVTHPTLPLQRTYCANCTRPWGWVNTDSSASDSPDEIQVLCDLCAEAAIAKAGGIPANAVMPQDWTRYGLVDENDPRVAGMRNSEMFRELAALQRAALATIRCPAPDCGSDDFHLEDNPDNPLGPQVAVCHKCSKGGLKRGWMLHQRVNLEEEMSHVPV